MNIPPYQFNSKIMPKDFPRDFDAHIYFEAHEFESIENLKNRIIEKWSNQNIFVGDIIGEPIGPHTLPMLEVNFPSSLFSDFTQWLMFERNHHPVLIHKLTGDNYRDHTQAALWLGHMVPLKYELFLKN